MAFRKGWNGEGGDVFGPAFEGLGFCRIGISRWGQRLGWVWVGGCVCGWVWGVGGFVCVCVGGGVSWGAGWI